MADTKEPSIFPTVQAAEAVEEPEEAIEEDEELVDPQEVLREECREQPKVESLLGRYNDCNDRVNAKTQTTETCEEELFDYIHALDVCVSKTLFSKLK